MTPMGRGPRPRLLPGGPAVARRPAPRRRAVSQLDDQGKPDQPAGGALKLRASIAFLLAMLAVAGGYYFLYSKPRSASLAARDFRILATLGHQVRKVVEGEGKVLNSLDRIQPLDGLTMAETLQQAPKLLGLTVHELHADGPDHEVSPPGLGKVSQTLEPTPDGEGQRLESDFACAGRTTLHSRRPLDEVLEPLFLSRLASEAFDPSRRAFDALLLADETGQWIYQPGHQGLPAMSVPRLDVLLLTPHPPLWAGAGKNAGAAPGSRLQAAMGSSQRFDIEIDGQSFALFVQPVPMPTLGVGKTGTQDHQPPKWLLCGLLSHEEITSQGLAVTPSYLAAAVAMLLLALFSWPLLKFKLHGERQRVRLVHLLMAALCSLLGISLVTLLLLDLYHHHQLERQSDRQVQALASRLEMNLEREVRKAYCQLVALESAATTSFVKSNAARPDPHRMRWDQVWDPRETIKGQVEPYPYWTDFALVDREGEQRLKWANGGLRSLRVNVAARSYFKSARDDVGLWRLPAWDRRRAAASGEVADCVPRDDPGKFRLESVVSLIRGVRQAQLSKPAARPLSADLDGRYSVATLTLPMLSTIRPVVPFGFTFMVVADDETREDVLFHLHPERNLSEDLFDETDGDPRLRSALRARHPATLDLRYEGEAFRASLVPIRGLPWTVVALQARGPVETANLLGVLTAAVLLLLYVGAFALVLSAIALVRPGYRAGWLWPARGRAAGRSRLVAAAPRPGARAFPVDPAPVAGTAQGPRRGLRRAVPRRRAGGAADALRGRPGPARCRRAGRTGRRVPGLRPSPRLGSAHPPHPRADLAGLSRGGAAAAGAHRSAAYGVLLQDGAGHPDRLLHQARPARARQGPRAAARESGGDIGLVPSGGRPPESGSCGSAERRQPGVSGP